MSALLAALYVLRILFLASFALLIFIRNPRSRLHRHFALLALALLGWVASLFTFDFQTAGSVLLWLGRFNFASILVAVTLGFLFVRDVAGRPQGRSVLWLWTETALLGTLTLLTPLVDRQELVRAGQHVTIYGPLFVPYVLHVLVLLGVMLSVAFGSQRRVPEQTGRQLRLTERQLRLTERQLRLIGGGIIATAVVAWSPTCSSPTGGETSASSTSAPSPPSCS